LSSNFNLCDLNICSVVVGFFLNLHGCLFTRNRIGGVMVSVLSSNAVDRGFIGGVMVSVLSSNAVDRGFIGGVMVSVLSSNAVDRGFKAPDQTKDYKIDICCFFAKHAALRRKNKDWLARNRDNVSEWSDMSIRGLLFQLASTLKIQLSVLV
jgi:hypothetical protein